MSRDEAVAKILFEPPGSFTTCHPWPPRSRQNDLGWDFWEELLPLLAAEPDARGARLLARVREELSLAKARVAVKKALD